MAEKETQAKKPFHKTILSLIEKRIPLVIYDQGAEDQINLLGGIFEASVIPEGIIMEIANKLKKLAKSLIESPDTKRARSYLMNLSERLAMQQTGDNTPKEEDE